MWSLVKSPERLAREIIGKKRYAAEAWLRKYGATEAQAAAAVTHVLGIRGTVVNDLSNVADTIYEECKK